MTSIAELWSYLLPPSTRILRLPFDGRRELRGVDHRQNSDLAARGELVMDKIHGPGIVQPLHLPERTPKPPETNSELDKTGGNVNDAAASAISGNPPTPPTAERPQPVGPE